MKELAIGSTGASGLIAFSATATIPPLKGEGGRHRRPGGVLIANETARRLRKTMTPQDVKLWVHLRSWRTRGYHFRRQSPRDGYIVDFVCLKYQLVVEVDGGQHNFDDHQQRDAKRDRTLERDGLRVLRFWNNEVDANLAGVLVTIDDALRSEVPHSAACGGHPPPAGEGWTESL